MPTTRTQTGSLQTGTLQTGHRNPDFGVGAQTSGEPGNPGRTREESRETMTSNGEDAGGTHQSSSAGDAAGGTDVVRELLLSLAANIDTIASVFAPPGHPAARPAAAAPGTTDTASVATGFSPGTAAFAAGAPGAGDRLGAQVPIGEYLAEASGEIAQQIFLHSCTFKLKSTVCIATLI